jgi:hypothetical protein
MLVSPRDPSMPMWNNLFAAAELGWSLRRPDGILQEGDRRRLPCLSPLPQSRAMQRFRSLKTLQKFKSFHAQVHNQFNQARDLVTWKIYKQRRSAAWAEWRALGA